ILSKSALFPTVSSQIGLLFSPNDEFTLVAYGKIPLVTEVDNHDEIIRVIYLKKELEHK
ncbi:hypothetical protein BGZ59_003896, partial [Podila verticillata]